MRAHKVVQKREILGIAGKDAADALQDMLSGNADTSICANKYAKIIAGINGTCDAFKMLQIVIASHFGARNEDTAMFCRELEIYITDCGNEIAHVFKYSAETDIAKKCACEAYTKAFLTDYDALKRSRRVDLCLIICKALADYKKRINDHKNFSADLPGIEWAPLRPICSVNCKELLRDAQVGDLTLTIFEKLLAHTTGVYDCVTMPDGDLEGLVTSLISQMESSKKMPEFARCADAFKKITESVELLRERIGDYYRDFAVTGDSTIILHNFVSDVAKETEFSPDLARQFNKIIAVFRARCSKTQDPRAKAMLEKIRESMRLLPPDVTK